MIVKQHSALTSTQLSEAAQQWLAMQLSADNGTTVMQPLAGDASDRHYIRLCYQQASHPIARMLLVMPLTFHKQDQADLAWFIELATNWYASGIHTPKIFASSSKHRLVLLEDFGDIHLADLVAQQQSTGYHAALEIMQTIAKQTISGERNFFTRYYPAESTLFPQWLPRLYPLAVDRQVWQQFSQTLYQSFCDIPQVTIHRDFHSRNLMVLHNTSRLGVLDFQDACRFTYVYDLASLIYDPYVCVPDSLANELEQHFSTHWSNNNVAVDVRLAAIQRLFKICGVFVRLAVRDNKTTYLQHLPSIASKTHQLYHELLALGDRRLARFETLFTQLKDVVLAQQVHPVPESPIDTCER